MSRFVTMIDLMAPYPQYLWEGWSFTPLVIVAEA